MIVKYRLCLLLVNIGNGALWLSGIVLDSRLMGSRVQALPEALHCVLEHDTLTSVQPRKTVPT